VIAGAIEIQMLADLARLKKDMDEAKGLVGTATKSMAAAADFAKGALAGIAAGLTVHAFTSWMKGAIDAGDATKEFAAKTGVAAKDVAGLQLAFKQGGVDADSLTGGIGKLSKQMVEGNDAFRRLGIETKNADGTMRGVKDVLYQTADAFAGIKDGAAKSALAQELFGKSGAALIPVLNEGADGMRAMAEMAEKLGLVIDEDTANAADSFNDTIELLGMGMQGVARQAMAQLLPAMNAVAGGFLEAMTEGDSLRKMSDVLAAGLKILYTVFAGGIQIIGTFGKVLGGVGAGIMALVSGDFGAVKTIGAELMNDIKTDWTKTIANIGSVWDGTAGKTVEAGNKIVKAQKDMQVATKATASGHDAAAKAEAKRAEEVAKLISKIEQSTQVMQFEADTGQKLTAVQKEALDIMMRLRDGTLVLTDAEKARLVTALEQKLATERNSLANAELAKTLAAVAQHSSKLADEEASRTAGMRATNVALIEENDKLVMGEAAWRARQIAVNRNEAADLEWQAANQGGNFQLEEQARLLRERAALLQQGVVVKEAQAAAAEWKKTTDSINDGLTDALFRAFESGKGFMKSLKDTAINAFKTMILKPTIQAIMAPVASGLGGLFGMTGSAQAGQGGGMPGGVGDLLGMGGSLFGAGGLGGALMAGAGWMGAGGSLLGTLGAAGSLIGTGSAGGIMAGLGMGAGALGPIALGIMALASLDKKSTPHVGGYAMADAGGGISDITAAMGGKQQASTQQTVATLAATVSALLNKTGGAFGKEGGISVRSVFESDSNDPSWGLFHLLRGGQALGGSFDAAGTLAADPAAGFAEYAAKAAGATLQALADMGLPEWAMAEFNRLGASATLDQMAAVAASVIDRAQYADGKAPEADPTDAPTQYGDPAPLWGELAANTKAMREAMDRLLEKASTAEGQATGTDTMVAGMRVLNATLTDQLARLSTIVDSMTLAAAAPR
jgi:hypothetical protein